MKNMVETTAERSLVMKIAFAICAFILAIVLLPAGTAHAAYSIPSNAQDSGTCGGCTWYITSASASSNPGQLVIYPTNGTSGTLADIKEATSPWIDSTAIQSIYVADGVKTSSTFKYAFRDCTSLVTADVSNLNTSAATTLAGIFYGCESLETIEGLEEWNISKATSLEGLFSYCEALQSVDLSTWNCAAVTTICEMFEEATGIESITLPKNGMPKLQNASSAFRHCESLVSIDVSGLVNSNLSSVYYLFSGCYELKDVVGYEKMVTNKVKNISFFFANCRELTSVDVSAWDVSNVTDFAAVFSNCRSIISIEGLDKWNTSNGIEFTNMFACCWELPSLTLGPNFKTSNGTDFSAMFLEAKELQVLDISMFDTTSATNMGSFFKAMPNLRQVTLGSKFSFTGDGSATCVLPTPDPTYIPGATGNWQAVGIGTVTDPKGAVYLPADVPSYVAETYVMEAAKEPILAAADTWYKGSAEKSTYTIIDIVDSYSPTGSEKESWDASAAQDGSVMAYVSADGTTLTIAGNGSGYVKANKNSSFVFDSFSSVTAISGTELLDTSSTTRMDCMFSDCAALESLNLDNWDVSNVYMFNLFAQNCYSLTSFGPNNLRDWNTGAVEQFSNSFDNCESLKALDVSKWDVSSCEVLNYIFSDCKSLVLLDVSKWDMSNALKAAFAFQNCTGLETLEFASWSTPKITDMTGFLYGCAFTTIDVSGLDLGTCEQIDYFFSNCKKLETIKGINTWNTGKVQMMTDAFYNCESLQTLDLSNWKTAALTNALTAFSGCKNLRVLDISGMDTSNALVSNMFKNCIRLQQVTLGENFTFTGADSTSCVLPTPDPAYIPGATGKWQAVGTGTVTDPKGLVYLPADVPNNVAETYVMESVKVPVLAPSTTWYKGTTEKSAFTVINVVDSYTADGSELESWDASAAQDGSVMAYVSADGKTLTIAGNGSGYIMANADSTGAFRDFSNIASFNGIGVLDTSETTSLSKLFMNCEKLTSVPELESLSTSKVTQFDYLFYQCELLPSADLSAWDFSSAEDIAHLFDFCYAVSSIKLPSEVMPNLKYAEQAFNDCESLTTLDVSCLASGKLVWATSLFQGCSNLSELKGYENLITSSTTQMACIFSGCNSLTTLSLENWNTENVDSLYGVFSNCKSLTSLTGLDHWDVSNVTNMRATFNDVSKLNTIEGITNWDVSSVEIFDKTFSQNDALVSLDLSGWNTDSGETFNYMFGESVSLKVLDISGFNTEVANDLKGMFTLNRCLQQVTLGEKFSFTGNGSTSCVLPTPDPAYIPGATGKWQAVSSGTVDAPKGTVYAPADVPSNVAETYVMEAAKVPVLAAQNTWYKGSAARGSYTTISLVDSYSPTGSEKESWDASAAQDGSVMAYVSADGKTLTLAGNGSGYIKANADSQLAFDEFSSATAYNGLALLDTSGALNMSAFFADNTSLTSLKGIEGWDVSNCTDLACFFSECTSLTGIDLSKWDMASAQTIGDFLYNCGSLVDLKTPVKTAGNLVDIYHAFESCESLESVDVSFMCSGKIANAGCVFQSCGSLKTITGYETLITSSTDDIRAIFNLCGDLEYLDLSQWVTDNVETISLAFGYTYSLSTIDGLENWNVGNCTDLSSTFISSEVSNLDGIAGWDVSNVETFDSTFCSATELTYLDLSSWSTDSAEDMGKMLRRCVDLAALKLGPGFSTENVVDFNGFLFACENLKMLDISMVDTRAAADMTDFFAGMDRLQQVTLGENFSFTGNGSTSCVLPTPDPEYITGAIGKWQAVGAGTVEKPAGTIYLPADVPSNVAETYVMPLTAISVDVPIKVTLAAAADGTWCTPTATANQIVNHSLVPVKVASAKSTAADGFTMLAASNVKSSAKANVFGGTIAAGAGTAQDLTAIDTSGSAWTMAAETDSDDSDLIGLQLAGSIGNVEGKYFTDGCKLFDITYTFELAL